MTTRQKIYLGAFFAVCVASGYAVYWWHETSLDNIATAHISYRGPALDKALAALREKRPADARAVLDGVPQFEKVGILKVLSRNDVSAVRMFAVRYMRHLRDIPQIRAELARITLEDPDETVTKLAARALEGKR